MANSLQFGISIDPGDYQTALTHARIADEGGLDLVTTMDHPYNVKLHDAWTLLTALAVQTERISVGYNVANIPLRTPAMVAKQALSLAAISDGRVVLPIGAGGYWEGIAAFGGPMREGSDVYYAFKDALSIIKGMLGSSGGRYSHDGDYYSVEGIRPGPQVKHEIPVWVGAYGPSMLKLTGRMADGVLPSLTYLPIEKLPWLNERLDEGAEQAGRSPDEIRRAYNLMGSINPGAEPQIGSEGLHGPVSYWVEQLERLNADYRIDTFLFWPTGPRDATQQVESFAGEVVPQVSGS